MTVTDDPDRLVARPKGPRTRARAPRPCLECGDPVHQPSTRPIDFCCGRCRKNWNNRRMLRGAEVYDLFMSLRYEREAAKKDGVWTTLTRLAQHFREADLRERDGRRTWKKAKDVRERRPHLNAIVVDRGRKR